MIGVPLGLLAGYRRGRFDETLMRTMDVLMSFPPIMLGLLILAVTPPALWKTIIAIGIVYVPPIVRITRSVTLDLANEEFIQAAHVRGERARYILFSEILPNAWPPIAVEASLRITFAILLGAALSFLGMGAQPPSSDWGLMVERGAPVRRQRAVDRLGAGHRHVRHRDRHQPARRRVARGARSAHAQRRGAHERARHSWTSAT